MVEDQGLPPGYPGKYSSNSLGNFQTQQSFNNEFLYSLLLFRYLRDISVRLIRHIFVGYNWFERAVSYYGLSVRSS